MRKLAVLGCVFVLACGPAGSQVIRLVEPHGPKVEVSHYPGYVRMLSGGHPVVKKSEAWCKDIECHEKVLRRIVREHFDVKTPLEFDYMYTGFDSTRNAAIVRYFAFNADPIEIAGWEVLLVYALSSGRLAQAFVAAVPLE